MVKRKKAKAKRPVKRPKARKTMVKRAVSKKKTAKRVKGKGARVKAVKRQTPEAALEKIGEVTHYFPKVKAAAILILKDSIKLGDEIYIKGHTTDFKEKVNSVQLDHVPIQEGKKGQEIGLLVKSRVRIGDSVYRL